MDGDAIPRCIVRQCGATVLDGTRGLDDRVKDYASFSFWLETSGDDLTPRPRLDGSIDVDVAIMGAGYTGLWTAYYLLRRDPSLRVAVVEREIAGFGASGRNGGWCYPGFPVSGDVPPRALRHRSGAGGLSPPCTTTVDEIERVIGDEEYRRAVGARRRAAPGARRAPAGQHRGRLPSRWMRSGSADHYELLDAAQAAERVRVTDVVAALYNPAGASVHPARLARGLARAVERHGGTIYEQTPGHSTTKRAASPRLITPYGDVRAKTLVLAGEAYCQQLPKLQRTLVPMYSLIVLTEPLAESDWDADRLAQPRVGRLVAHVGRLSQPHRRWPHPLRRAGRAVPHALADRRRPRPARTDPRHAARG